MSTEYRLTWEMPDARAVVEYEAQHGGDVWTRLPWTDDWFDSWHAVSRVTTDPWDQHKTLKAWAESREQPIRNVELERRDIRPDDWQPVPGIGAL